MPDILGREVGGGGGGGGGGGIPDVRTEVRKSESYEFGG